MVDTEKGNISNCTLEIYTEPPQQAPSESVSVVGTRAAHQQKGPKSENQNPLAEIMGD